MIEVTDVYKTFFVPHKVKALVGVSTQIAAGDAPDIMNIGDDAVPQFVDAEAFLALDDFIAGEDGLDAIRILARARGFIRAELVRRKLGLRYLPELRFLYDDSIARGSRIKAGLDCLLGRRPVQAIVVIIT